MAGRTKYHSPELAVPAGNNVECLTEHQTPPLALAWRFYRVDSMTAKSWMPPRPFHHLRIFGISLGLVVLSLGGFLFGVSLEAVTPAQGIILSRDQQEIRTPIAGLVEPGWF